MVRSVFDFKGLNLGTGDKNITYLYGLSDFWAVMFEGNDKINLLVEANAQTSSDIYSKFLQLTSTISLEHIQTDIGYQTKLVLINEVDFVAGSINVYNLPEFIVSSRFLADRPLLPNLMLEEGVHFSIINDGTQIQFFSPLNSLGFPTRVNADGTKDYAIWFTDAEVDEFTIWQYYGKILGLDVHTSTENFRNFVQGLFYLFVNGPTVDWLKKGLNLALGIPLARATETVLDIRKYLDTDQYLVTTDANSYLIPFGLVPTVAVDDILHVADMLAEYIQVKDWLEDGQWWLNLYIPSELIPYIPTGQTDRHALPGSYSDYLMANFLKQHSFLVNVVVVDHSNLEFLVQIPSILSKAKPTYTYPVYIWTVPNDELLYLDDNQFSYRWDQFLCDNMSVPINIMTRNIVYGNFYQNYDYTRLAISNNGLKVTCTSVVLVYSGTKTDFGKQSGKWYWEITIIDAGSFQNLNLGVGTSAAPLQGRIGDTVDGWSYWMGGGITYRVNNGASIPYGSTFGTGTVVGVALDLDARTLTFYNNGVSQGVAFTGLPAGTYFPMLSLYQNTSSMQANFGQTAFVYSPPTGFFSGFFDKLSLTRSCPQFLRSNISNNVKQLVGGSDAFNGVSTNLDGGILNGFINVEAQYRANTNQELAWLRAIVTRNTNEPVSPRGNITLNRRSATPGIFPVYTLTSTGTKATVRFNPYATWKTFSPQLTINGGNISHNQDAYSWGTTVADIGVSSDRWYWEAALTALPANSKVTIGVGDQSISDGNNWMGLSNMAWGIDVEKTNILNMDGTTNLGQVSYDASKTNLNCLGSNTQSFTIEYRFMVFTPLPATGDMFSHGAGPFNTGGAGVEVRIRNSGLIEACRSDGTLVAPTRISSAAGSVNVNIWYHFVFTYDATTAKGYIYLDGLAQGNSGAIINTSGVFVDNYATIIGSGTDSFFHGAMTEVRVLNRFMGATEAFERAKYSNKNNFGTLAYWPLTETTGTTMFDLSGNNNDGVYVGTLSRGSFNFTRLINNGVYGPQVAVLNQSDIIGFNFSTTSKTLFIRKNNVLLTSVVTSGALFPMVSINSPATSVTINTGDSAFTYSPSAGSVPGIYDNAKTYQYAVGEIVTIAGATNAGYNGTFSVTEAGPNTFSYTLAGSQPSPDTSTSSTIYSAEGLGVTAFDQLGGAGIIYPLYITTQSDIAAKFTLLGFPVPTLSTWVFTLFKSTVNNGPINSHVIDGSISTNYFSSLTGYYSTVFFRGPNFNYLGHFMPAEALNYTYAPALSDLMQGDYLLFIRIQETTVGVYWVTTNATPSIKAPAYFPLKQTDPMTYSLTAALSRGLGPSGSPYYTLRGDAYTLSYNNDREINEVTINDTETLPSLIQTFYTDPLNIAVPINRSGTPRIAMKKELS